MPGPWDDDAAAYFGENAEAIAAFDKYMTEKQQPYVTQLEEGTKDARELWTDLNADPEKTLRDLFTSVYPDDPDAAARYDSLFTAVEPPEPVAVQPPPPPADDEVPEYLKPVVEDYNTRRDARIAEEQATEYAEFKQGLKESHGLTDDDLELIDPFIAVSAHDVDAAVARYKAFLAKAGPPAPEPTPTPTPPPVVGGEGSTSATPPLATKYTSYNQIGEALQSHLAQQRLSSTPPPVVG